MRKRREYLRVGMGLMSAADHLVTVYWYSGYGRSLHDGRAGRAGKQAAGSCDVASFELPRLGLPRTAYRVPATAVRAVSQPIRGGAARRAVDAFEGRDSDAPSLDHTCGVCHRTAPHRTASPATIFKIYAVYKACPIVPLCPLVVIETDAFSECVRTYIPIIYTYR